MIYTSKLVFYIQLLLLFIPFLAFSDERDYGRSFDLGYGFVKKYYTVENPEGHWESFSKKSTIIFKDNELGSLDGFRITPSRKYAVYARLNSEKLYLFDIAKEEEIEIHFDQRCNPSKPLKENNESLQIGCLGEKKSFFSLNINLLDFTIKYIERAR